MQNAYSKRGGVLSHSESHYKELLGQYKKLQKTFIRTVHFSDRNEEKLSVVAKKLDQQNHNLHALSLKLAKYLSPQVYESIFSGDRDVVLTTERKKLTVFFSDIKNFTQTTCDLQPEDLTYILNNYFTEMSEIALKHGAIIDKFIGDAMLMFFGDPKSNGVKEDAQACVKMAVEMQNRMQDLDKKWSQEGFIEPFRMRIGINTGYCDVGNFGSNVRMDYTIIGGEVNLSARLEGKADPGGVLMSYETYMLVKDVIDVEERPLIKVKGFKDSIRNFSVLGLKNKEDDGRFIRTEKNGMLITLDLDELHNAKIPSTIDALKELILTLENRVS